jgi:hypothetical protein
MSTTIGNYVAMYKHYYKQIMNAFASLNRWAVVLVLVALPAHAAVYFVDIGQGSDSNSGTSTTAAWAHLPGTVGFSGSGWVTIRNGDTIQVKGGTVNNVQVLFDSSRYSGSSSFNSIVIQSGHLANPVWGTGQAVIDGQNTRTYGLMITANGITVDGFEVREIAAGAAPPLDTSTGSCCVGMAGASYVTLRRSWLHNAYSTGPSTDVGFGIEMSGGSNFIIAQNHIGPSIQMKGIEPYRSTFGVISNNFISGTAEHGLAMNNCANWDVCNNVIRHDPPYGPEPSWAIAMGDSKYNDVWNNLIFRSVPVSKTVPLYYGLGIGMYGNNSSNRFAFNTIAYFNDPANAGSHQTAISIERGANVNVATGFYNNLIYSNYNALGPVGYCVNPDVTTQNEMMYCDIFAGSATELVMSFEISGSDNLRTVADFSPSCGTYAHNVQVDPGLTKGTLPSGLDANWHPNTAFFQLTAGSPATVTSTGNALTGNATYGFDHSTGKFSSDIIGNKRANWSMGAYEAGAGTAAPLPPTGLRLVTTP